MAFSSTRPWSVAALFALSCFAAAVTHAAAEYRTFDGTLNNLANPDWGSADTQLLRWKPSDYADGISAMAGPGRPSTRLISNALCSQSGSILNARGLSDFVWQWGQFLDHDLDLTPGATPTESHPIPVPQGDPFFDPLATGTSTIPFSRSKFDPATGTVTPRQQVNLITSWIDASNVYGSEDHRADELRTGTDGLLKTSAGGSHLPLNVDGLENEIGPNTAANASSTMFLAGDVRANEQIGLLAMHTLFVREHNRLAVLFKASNSSLSDEEIFQLARVVVAAEMQLITYEEFLPALLGSGAVGPYAGYNASVNAGITNEFSSANYRFGHSMISGTILLLEDDGSPDPMSGGSLDLRDAFFNPALAAQIGLDAVLKGLASNTMQEVDLHVTDDVRNFLFGPPGAGGLDLAALNIQRGRDHGLNDFNSLRVALGLPSLVTFGDITSNPAVAATMQSLYGSVNDIDIWVGTLAEDHVPGGSTGPTLKAALSKMFGDLRDGDRFFYLNDPVFADAIAMLGMTIGDFEAEMRLGRIIELNSGLSNLQSNVFFASQSSGSASMKSDPHIKGLQGQEFDFTGEDGKVYNLITDVATSDAKNHLVVNAVMGQSYETQILMANDGKMQNYGPVKGKTWITGLSVVAGNSSVALFAEMPDQIRSRFPTTACQANKCLSFGQVVLDKQQIRAVGEHIGADMTLNVTLSNSKSFSRVVIQTPNLHMTADIVSPPTKWMVPESQQGQYSHINMKIESVKLFSFYGVVGETGMMTESTRARKTVKGKGANGEGILLHNYSHYQVPNLVDEML